MATKYPGLANHLRKWGLKVEEVKGWQTRQSGATFAPKGVMVHHTATKGPKNAPSLGIVTNGRAGLSGPLSQFLLARDGTVYVVGGGKANHAGVGKHGSITNGNTAFWGIEAENDGVGEKWTTVQLNAYYRLCAALLDMMKADVSMVIAHKEWATPRGRKSDPAGIDMGGFRANVKKALDAGFANKVAPTGDRWLGVKDPMLEGQDVTNVQNALIKAGFLKADDNDGVYGYGTANAVRLFQIQFDIVERGCGPETWKALRLVAHT